MNQISYKPIGIIHSPFTEIDGIPIQPSAAKGIKGQIVIKKEYVDGLYDLDGFSHIYLLYHLHLSTSYNLRIKPFLDDQLRGVFSTRAPRRPNPIGLSVVKLVKIDFNKLEIANVDIIETNNKTAEMIKYTSNSLLATMISFSNEIGNLCASIGGVDVVEVM